MRLLIQSALKLHRRPSKSNLSSALSTSTFSHIEFGMGDEKFEGHTVIREGEAEILVDSSNSVFYNKVQVHNRDMSIAVLRTFISKRKEEHASMSSKGSYFKARVLETANSGLVIDDSETQDSTKTTSSRAQEVKAPKVLEALAASGLRSLRYACEVDGIGKVVALDHDEKCIDACKRNISFNGPVASSIVEAHFTDSRVYMLTHPKEFDVIDLDPYGSPSTFLDSAIQSVADGGLLMCTATDMSVLCGENSVVGYSKYGSYPLKGKYCHEMALRILLACIESHANRYKRYIIPVLSVYMDFYIRVFVRVFTSASVMRNTPLKLSYVYQCVGCDSFHLQSLGRAAIKNDIVKHAPGFGPVVPQECSDCGQKYNMGGPIWSAPIHDQEWVTSILQNVRDMKDRYPAYRKIVSVLTSISEELPDIPLFISPHSLSATVKCPCPSSLIFRSAVLNAGYHISGSHINPLVLKTNAPMSVIWDIMRCWVKLQKVQPRPKNPSGVAILSKQPALQADFSSPTTLQCKAQSKKEPRFLPNPEKYWGPKMRAGRQITSKHCGATSVG